MKFVPVKLAVLGFILVALVAQFVLHNYPNSADEYAYVFQAKNLAEFQTYAPVHPNNHKNEDIQYSYFYFVHVGHNDFKYYGRFPPGYSVLLVPAIWFEQITGINAFWATNAFFAALSLMLLYLFGREFFSHRVGLLAIVFSLASSWFLFNSASYFSHTTNAFFVGLFLYLFCLGLKQSDQDRANKFFLGAGACFGFAVLIRFLDPLPYLLVIILLYSLWRMSRKKLFFKDVSYFILGGIPFACWMFYYNYSLTGNPFLTPYEFYNPHDQGTRFIFSVVDNKGNSHWDFSRILDIGFFQRTIPNVKLLFQWHIYSWMLLLLPYALWITRKNKNQLLLVSGLFLSLLMIVLIYMLYGGPPMNQYGPRYYYSFYFPITLLAAFCVSILAADRYVVSTIALGLVFLGGLHFWEKVMHYEPEVYDRKNLFRTIDHKGITNAVVFVHTNSGSMHTADLIRNELDFSNDVIVANTNSGKYGPMIRAYPNRSFYEYYYRKNEEYGDLIPLATQADGSFEYKEKIFSPADVNPTKSGLVGHYYSGADFNKKRFERLDKRFDFKWKSRNAIKTLTNRHFSVKWKGAFIAKESGEYKFISASDDGVKIKINRRILIDNWYPHGVIREKNQIFLKKGLHYIEIDYFDVGGEASFKVQLKPPQEPWQILNEKYLMPLKKTIKH